MTYFRLHPQPAPATWRLEALRPILPHPLEHLIEVLAPVFVDPAPRRTVLADPALGASLLQIGLTREAEGRFVVAGAPVHPFTHDAAEYFRYCKVRERYMLGISERVEASAAGPVLRGAAVVEPVARVDDSFASLAARRRSAAEFEGRVERVCVETLLQDCFYVRPDGHFPFATAGGFAAVGMLIGFESALYDVDPQSRRWTERRAPFDNGVVRAIGFSQAWAGQAAFWLIPYVRFGESASKYGARAYRFALLAAGAVLQQAALSGASIGLASRVLGGFDDVAAGQLCRIDEAEEMVVGFMGFGPRSSLRQ